MTGNEIRINARYPDFRDEDLYDEDLPSAKAIFDINFFRKKPEYFYRFAKEYLTPGKFKPTKAHYLAKFLEDRGLLQIYITECIDKIMS